MIALVRGTEGAIITHSKGATQRIAVQLLKPDGYPLAVGPGDTIEVLVYTSQIRTGTAVTTYTGTADPAFGSYGYFNFNILPAESLLSIAVPYYVWVRVSKANAVDAVALSNSGTGFSSAPSIAFRHLAGLGARATAVISSGVDLSVSSPGSGYTTATVYIDEPAYGGVRAAATATLSAGNITGVAITERGFGYITAPGVNIVGDGTGGAITATLTGRIRHINVLDGGGGYTSAPDVLITGGGGTGAVATASVSANGPVQISRTSFSILVA